MIAASKRRFAATRRGFLARSSFLVGVLALPGGLSACTGKVPPMVVDAVPVNLSPWHFQTLARLSEMILPATDTPGAIAAGVPQFIDGLLTDWAKPETKARYEAALDLIDEGARAAHGDDFLLLGEAEQIALLTAHEKMCFGKKANEAEADSPGARAGYRDLKKMIYRGYYYSEVGCTQELQYQLIPGPDARIDAPLAEIGRSWAL